METNQKEKKILPEGLIHGTWQLTYKLTNSLGPAGFSGKMITDYRDPFTGTTRFLTNAEGQRLLGHMINSPVEMYHPDRNPDHMKLVDWLVGHPEVGIQNDQCKVSDRILSRKISNPRITLVNLDHQDVTDLEHDDYIDKLVGVISEDHGKKAIGIDRLRFILSALNLNYREEKYITEPKIEKQKLRKRLKDYVRSSYDNAVKVNGIIDNIEAAKLNFEIKEMLRINLLTQSGGTYMYKGNPIGISFESLRSHFDNNPKFYADLTKELYDRLQE